MIKKLKTHKEELNDKIRRLDNEISMLQLDKFPNKDIVRLKLSTKLVSEIQDICDKIDTLLCGMIKS